MKDSPWGKYFIKIMEEDDKRVVNIQDGLKYKFE